MTIIIILHFCFLKAIMSSSFSVNLLSLVLNKTKNRPKIGFCLQPFNYSAFFLFLVLLSTLPNSKAAGSMSTIQQCLRW